MEKGILACLLRHGETTRFFSGPEIAPIHGAVRPIFLHGDQRTQMRLLGNAISVPQAMVPLVHACCYLGLEGVPEPAEAVAWCLQARIHNGNSALVPFGTSWVLCHRSQTAEVLKAHELHCPDTLHAFTEVCLQHGAPGAASTGTQLQRCHWQWLCYGFGPFADRLSDLRG